MMVFDESVSGRDLAARCREVDLYEPISVHVHVPLCRDLCGFGESQPHIEHFGDRALQYVRALVSEIALHANALQGRGRPASVLFCGGAPNCLDRRGIARVLSAIEAELGLTDDARLAIELDPRFLSAGGAEEFVSLGFARCSLGAQEFDPALLAAADRMRSFDHVAARVGELRAAGVADLSCDVHYGRPGQTVASFADTLDQVVRLGPDGVRVLEWARPQSDFARTRTGRPAKAFGARSRAVAAQAADRRLVEAGYECVGFDHYARRGNPLARAAADGRLRRSLQGFTDDPSSVVLGVGASAISFCRGLFAQNEADADAYVEQAAQGGSPVVRGRRRTRREEIVAAAIEDILCRGEADLGGVLEEAPPSEGLRIRREMGRLETKGVVEWRGDRLSMAAGAKLFARAVAAALDPLLTSEAGIAVAG